MLMFRHLHNYVANGCVAVNRNYGSYGLLTVKQRRVCNVLLLFLELLEPICLPPKNLFLAKNLLGFLEGIISNFGFFVFLFKVMTEKIDNNRSIGC